MNFARPTHIRARAMYNDIAYLIQKSVDGVDEYGDPKIVETSKEIFCNIMSVGQKEFYDAQTVGAKPELKIVIADYYDYTDEDEIEVIDYRGRTRYQVLRTYRVLGSNELEITLYGGVRNERT